jgi:hypothetical protein
VGLGIVGARRSENGLVVKFMTEHGPTEIEGSEAEISRLAEVMTQVAALAPLNEIEQVWIEDVVVGDSVVKLGLAPGGVGRVRITNPARPPHEQ